MYKKNTVFFKKSTLLLIIIFLFPFSGCTLKKEVLLSGKTMGTTYHIKIVGWFFQNINELQEKIDNRLDEINRSMSIYIKDSEISRFNALDKTGEKFPVSDDFLNVVTVGAGLYNMSDGAWDGTIKPLVNLWGFGNLEQEENTVPDDGEIKKLLEGIGFNHIEIFDGGFIVKKLPAISLDFASIAKGYGVDQIAELILENGYTDFLVEIGGEIRASGVRKDKKLWRVGINTPVKGSGVNQVYKILDLQESALATSGDYRIFFEAGGQNYSHILDPRTGYPVTNKVVSVTVITRDCVLADGLATAIMVMGHEKGLALINRLDHVEGLIVTRKDDGSLIDFQSKGFKTAE
ncbi:MAG: FAD:protein FMN transferase [Desulfobacterales bacterium]|nr:FAD:protein FMN transferase [Desulfobacterales bacterium]